MDWDDVRHFLALARGGSARAAGAALGVSHSTVARRLEALESRLATRLFDRTPEGYALTEAGRRTLGYAERVEQEIGALERGVSGQDERLEGPVAITCSDAWISGMLIRGLTGLVEAHPGIEPRLSIDARPYDLSRREADLALRALPLGVGPPGELIATKLGPITLGAYVGAAHAERLSEPGAGRWLSFEDREIHARLLKDPDHPDLPLWGSFGSLDLLVQGALAGWGLVLLPTYVGEAEPALRRLPRPGLRHLADLWLLSHPDLRANARLLETRAWVTRIIRAERGLFEGA